MSIENKPKQSHNKLSVFALLMVLSTYIYIHTYTHIYVAI